MTLSGRACKTIQNSCVVVGWLVVITARHWQWSCACWTPAECYFNRFTDENKNFYEHSLVVVTWYLPLKVMDEVFNCSTTWFYAPWERRNEFWCEYFYLKCFELITCSFAVHFGPISAYSNSFFRVIWINFWFIFIYFGLFEFIFGSFRLICIH